MMSRWCIRRSSASICRSSTSFSAYHSSTVSRAVTHRSDMPASNPQSWSLSSSSSAMPFTCEEVRTMPTANKAVFHVPRGILDLTYLVRSPAGRAESHRVPRGKPTFEQ